MPLKLRLNHIQKLSNENKWVLNLIFNGLKANPSITDF